MDEAHRCSARRQDGEKAKEGPGTLMSTDYRPLGPIRMTNLFGGRLNKAGVNEHWTPDTTSVTRCLTDGRNAIWAYAIDDEATVTMFTRYAGNDPEHILRAIGAEFNVRIVSEHESEFWDRYQVKH